MNDKQLRQNVVDELDFEPSVDSANIGVAAENGVVTLSGHVPDYAQKRAAERAAWRVKGVKALAEELQVRFPTSPKLNDDEIAQRALKILAWSTTATANQIKVKVQQGWVTLTGTVNWHFERMAAEAAVRKLSGVVGISNDITLAQAVQPSDVKDRILGALRRHAEVEADRIQVDVRPSGTVEIEGHVDNWDERRAVERAVWSIPGVRAVEDHLAIK